jgi:Mg2+ and Co2+ transporter CorA
MLAVVSTIFLPITFLAGVYGTNFDQWFPEVSGFGFRV